MTDFFISYTSADETWAEWIGYVLEEEGFSISIQAWDFRPGSNFVLEMQKAATEAKRTIMVLSPSYLKSQFASPEWAAAFAQDPQGWMRTLVPIVVQESRAAGLLKSLVHINLVNKSEEVARTLLLNGIREGRAKPTRRPSFPGGGASRSHKNFPGATLPESRHALSQPYMPNIRREPSDIEKRRFLKEGFETIRSHFEIALRSLAEHEVSVDCEFQLSTATDFSAEIFWAGNSRCRCSIRQSSMFGEGITYAEGRSHSSDNSVNEILSLSTDNGELCLSSTMGFSFGRVEVPFDLKKMTGQQAAEYLWRRFIAPLER